MTTKSPQRNAVSSSTPEASDSPLVLRILIVEDSHADAELLAREVTKHGFDLHWTCVDTEEEFLRQVREPYDLIFADAIMPLFSARRVLELLATHQIDIPCIIISGSIGEEEAVALIRGGAADYLMKDRVGQLGQTIRRVRDQHKLRIEHRQAHHALIALNSQLEQRIAERTAELERLNHNLAHELAERGLAEERLREHEASLERRVAVRTEQLSRSHGRIARLITQLTMVEHQERKRLAGELHDYLAQLLVVAQLKLAHVKRSAALPESVQKSLADGEQALDQSLTFTRTLVSELSPSILTRQGLVAGLQALREEMHRRKLDVAVRSNVQQVLLSEQQAVLLYQSIRELLINISKHAQASTAKVELSHDMDSGITITVSDDGQGFDADGVLEDSTGFGLLSVRERLHNMGGSFQLRSTLGLGTQVVLKLPAHVLSQESSAAVMPRPIPSLSPATERSVLYRVLVVDDHDLVRREIIQLLQNIPYLTVVGEASNGEQAVSLTTQLNPDLVMMDIQMPIMDGVAATSMLMDRHPGLKIIGMSAHRDQTLHDRMQKAGAAISLVKDALPAELGKAIDQVLKSR